jgi:MoxR-like ATPase
MPVDDAALALGPRLTREVLEPLKAAFVGKDEVVDLLGVALAAGENVFLLGPPGTAKSALVQELARRLEAQTFDYLLTRFTEPNELFGPFDIRKLREGELLTNTEGMLPEAELVFLDELLNANSAILNSLLTVLNERVFRRGRETRALPTLTVVGASNRLPEDEALGALFDRFLLRVRCLNVDDDRLGEVLGAGWSLERARDGASPAGLGAADVRRLQAALGAVDLSRARPLLVDLVRKLRGAGLAVSDRRAVKLQRLIAASALLCGRAHAQVSDLWVARYVWDTEEQIEVLQALVGEVLAKADDEDAAHPRARGSERPDPEALARDLDAVGRGLEAADSESARAALRDRLAALAGRCQWVGEEPQRGELQTRVDALWERLDEPA